MGRVSEYIEKEYGFPLETVEVIVVLNAAVPVAVLPNDPNRVSWTCFNLGAAIGAIGFTPDVSVVAPFNGILLAAAGGMTGATAREDGELPCHAIWGIGAGATTLYLMVTRAI